MIIREYEKDEITVQKVPLMLMGGIVAISLALTAAVRLGLFERSAVSAVARAEAGITPAQQRTLRFFDESDGTVRVEDGATGEVLARYRPGEGGFVRASVRSLVHQRRIRGEGPQVAFDLIRWSDGSLTLSDPVTGYTVEVSAFGPFNRILFERMLPVGEGR
jgi:putative photosynthetic complex assembly protein